jgi:phosphoribosyl-dephospho-CoA transferase
MEKAFHRHQKEHEGKLGLMKLLPHDLIKVMNVGDFCASRNLPLSAEAYLKETPYVVVRRGLPAEEEQITVGIRGEKRSERWAAELSEDNVENVYTPGDVLRIILSAEIEGISAVFRQALKDIAESSLFPDNVGPGGSVAFTAVSGKRATHKASDLDLIIRYEAKLPEYGLMEQQLAFLEKLPLDCDAVIQTDHSIFSLKEAVKSPGNFLLKKPDGSVALTSLADLRGK